MTIGKEPDPNKNHLEQLGDTSPDPQLFFEQFTERMKREGHEFEVRADSMSYRSQNKIPRSLRFTQLADGEDLGSIWTEYDEDRNILTIVSVGGKNRKDPREYWKPKGIASALLACVLMRYPDTKEIEGTKFINSDNNRVYMKGLSEGLSQEDALKKTPAYKIRTKFGYSVIDLERWKNEEHLVTRKP